MSFLGALNPIQGQDHILRGVPEACAAEYGRFLSTFYAALLFPRAEGLKVTPTQPPPRPPPPKQPPSRGQEDCPSCGTCTLQSACEAVAVDGATGHQPETRTCFSGVTRLTTFVWLGYQSQTLGLFLFNVRPRGDFESGRIMRQLGS